MNYSSGYLEACSFIRSNYTQTNKLLAYENL